MEQIDVSWMTHGKDKLGRHSTKLNLSNHQIENTPRSTQPLESTTPSKINGQGVPISPPPSPLPATTTATKAAPARPGWGPSGDEKKAGAPNNTTPQRRGSWFSKISAPFSSPNSTSQPAPAATSDEADTDAVSPLPKIVPNKNAVLPHATRQSGDGPYVPAPPKTSQPGFFQVFRRRSSSNLSMVTGRNNHGLVERRILNVDKQRERPRLSELHPAKLRRVAFCVDVEIAPMPRYTDSDGSDDKLGDKSQKRKATERGEGEALKRPKEAQEDQDKDGVVEANGELSPKVPAKEGTHDADKQPRGSIETPNGEPKPEKETTRKKEKKKKSEAERKAKKEAKRKEALEKGAIPMEIHLDSDSSTEDVSLAPSPKPNKFAPTTNPGRIYRRCCQLRETDILTKITSQLPKTGCADGIVEKLDLTGYFMSLQDLITLGDFLAVVPVKELILEGCGLLDEGVRVVLAGLLASKKQKTRQRRSITRPADLCEQGGIIERLVLKNNKLGVEGWKHICLFIHMCRSLKALDLSNITFPAPSEHVRTPISHHLHSHAASTPVTQIDLSLLLSKALGERLGGNELELLNLGETGLTTNQLGAVVDGCLKSGVSRLGLAHNDLDAQGIEQVAKYLRGGKCQGLDLGGNDLRDHLQIVAEAVSQGGGALWALSLANCNLKPGSLCKLFPQLVQLASFKFIDLSHNHELCEAEPSAIGLLRRYLPKLHALKRLHLADVAMSSEQAIALAEVLPEVSTLAHVNLLENPKLVRLADAKTEEIQEEACALYASLLAAARVSSTLVKIDIDTPSGDSPEVVKALANQSLAYCLRNMRMAPDLQESGILDKDSDEVKVPAILRHIIGHDDTSNTDVDDDDDSVAAPDEDYVIGGTGVAKALSCCLDNLDEISRRDSGEFIRDLETGTVAPRTKVPAGKAKDMSKHLLSRARQIRVRLHPVLAQAKAHSNEDRSNYHRLLFLDQTLEGIITRFENEFPETRQQAESLAAPTRDAPPPPRRSGSFSSGEVEPAFTDTEEAETQVRPSTLSRSNSVLSSTSRQYAEEEGRALRVGHRFRSGLLPAHYDLLTSPEEICKDKEHRKLVESLMEEVSSISDDFKRKVETKGVITTFLEDRDEIFRRLRDKDPAGWDRFIESQEKARANVQVGEKTDSLAAADFANESAIAD